MPGVSRILAVDDNPDSLVQIEAFLDSDEFHLTTARGGREAFDLLLVEDFDLILLDVAMPEMGGMEVCQRLKADPRTKQIPVIFLTARMRDEADKLAAFEVGGVDYLSKPFHRDELLARIRVVLQLQREHTQLEAENHELTASLHQTQEAAERLREDATEVRELRRAALHARHGHLIVDDAQRIVSVDTHLASWLDVGITAQRALGDMIGPLGEVLMTLARAGHGDTATASVTGIDGEPIELEFQRTDFTDGRFLVEITDVSEISVLEHRISGRAPVATQPAAPPRHYRVRGMIGEAASLVEVAELVDRLRNVRSTVLIQGETGTGKELIARALHFDGQHAQRPFIPIHCGAISPELIESELFGYEKGAFTGALTSKQGLFSAADGGTVFLDEVGEMSPDLQIKLLRVLQLGEVRPVGATHPRHVDVRIIAATNQDLKHAVAEGWFREDLYYRLDVVKIRVPPLRERVEDIALLAQHFLERLARRDRETVLSRTISQGAVEALESYPWPGNVRELENVVDGALARGCGEVLQASDLPDRIRIGPESLQVDVARGPRPFSLPRPEGNSLRSQRARVDKLAMMHALARFDGDKREAARFLGMSRSTFYRKLKQFGVG